MSSPRTDLNIADIAAHPGLALCWGVVGLLGLLMLWFMWPLVILGGLFGGGYWLWKQQQAEQERHERQQNRLNHKFYELLQHRQGRISALELAMYTRLSGTQARHYLHHQAQALGAYFERTVHGDIIYIFDLEAIYSGTIAMTPAEVAWAYAERERARAQSYRTAQANARQMSALRQLSERTPERKLEPQPRQTRRLNPSPKALDAQAAIAAQNNAANPTVAQKRGIHLADDSVITIDVSAAEG